MTPNFEDRIASVVRALSVIIMPALPANAGLAREQAQLCLGHLSILRAQLGALQAYEQEEADDARALAEDLFGVLKGCAHTAAAAKRLKEALGRQLERERSAAAAARLNAAISEALSAAADAPRSALERASSVTLRHEATRAAKDRAWFAAMGFDADFAPS